VQVVYRTQFGHTPEDESGRASLVTMRRTPAGWRILTGWNDAQLFEETTGYSIIHIQTKEERQEQRAELAKKVVTWPIEGGEGRAFVVGYTGGAEPRPALAIEVTRPGNAPVRTDIPAAVFPRLAEFLYTWPTSPDE
jgi:hypothetical protein